MAILLRVKWVDKSGQAEPYQRIRRIAGDSGQMRWQHSQAQAIESIERGQFAYYVEKNARVLKLDVGLTADGNKYLTVPAGGGDTQLAGGGDTQLLLDLPDIPDSAPAVSKRD